MSQTRQLPTTKQLNKVVVKQGRRIPDSVLDYEPQPTTMPHFWKHLPFKHATKTACLQRAVGNQALNHLRVPTVPVQFSVDYLTLSDLSQGYLNSKDRTSTIHKPISVKHKIHTDEYVLKTPKKSGITKENPDYSYSTNCGWIDWGHAWPGTKEKPGTAWKLINRVYQASEKLKSVGARAPHKKQKFDTPAMDARGLGAVFSSAAIQLRLLRPLSDSEVLGVSLNLFKKLSIIFEIQQEWTDILTGSAFSEEDLPSNLISFYRAAKGYDRNQINQYCHAWNQVDSLKEYNRDHDFKKNFDFTSVAAKGQWPKELANIDDGNMSNLYEISAISTTQGSDNFYFCPVYRVGRRLGGSDLFITHIGGKDFTFSDNLLVIPTYRARFGTSGQFGHVQFTEVKPYKQRDISLFKRYKIPSPIYVPAPILACLGG